jgi:hypothetical protein
MSPESIDLDAAQALVDDASPGPWRSDEEVDTGLDMRFTEAGEVVITHGQGWEADAEFIAEARTLVPALIAELRLQRKLSDAYRRLLGERPSHDEVRTLRDVVDFFGESNKELEATIVRVKTLAERMAHDGDLIAASDIRKALEGDEGPEEWATWQEVPDGVQYRSLDGIGPWFNWEGRRLYALDGEPSRWTDTSMAALAPFVKAAA